VKTIVNLTALLAALIAIPMTPGLAQQRAAVSGNTGTIVFFRDKKFAGGGVGFKVREGDVELGRLRNGSYFTIQASPGKHEYTVHSEKKDVLTLEVDPGETYYVQANITVGVLAGRPNLAPSDKAAFEALKSKLKDVTGQGIGQDDEEDDDAKGKGKAKK
jgi:hypothetical protein